MTSYVVSAGGPSQSVGWPIAVASVRKPFGDRATGVPASCSTVASDEPLSCESIAYQMPIPEDAHRDRDEGAERGQHLRSRRALRRTGRSGVSVKPVLLSDASMLAAVPSLPTSPYCPTRPRKLSLPAARNRSLTVR